MRNIQKDEWQAEWEDLRLGSTETETSPRPPTALPRFTFPHGSYEEKCCISECLFHHQDASATRQEYTGLFLPTNVSPVPSRSAESMNKYTICEKLHFSISVDDTTFNFSHLQVLMETVTLKVTAKIIRGFHIFTHTSCPWTARGLPHLVPWLSLARVSTLGCLRALCLRHHPQAPDGRASPPWDCLPLASFLTMLPQGFNVLTAELVCRGSELHPPLTPTPVLSSRPIHLVGFERTPHHWPLEYISKTKPISSFPVKLLPHIFSMKEPSNITCLKTYIQLSLKNEIRLERNLD